MFQLQMGRVWLMAAASVVSVASVVASSVVSVASVVASSVVSVASVAGAGVAASPVPHW